MTDWNNARISYSECNKVKREFMEMLYIKKEGTYFINLKTDLVKYNGCYDNMIALLKKTVRTLLEHGFSPRYKRRTWNRKKLI